LNEGNVLPQGPLKKSFTFIEFKIRLKLWVKRLRHNYIDVSGGLTELLNEAQGRNNEE
jgi:hypothetical protein